MARDLHHTQPCKSCLKHQLPYTGNQHRGPYSQGPSTDLDCTDLGVGSRCTAIGASGSFCTVACGEDLAPCTSGFTCLAMVNQCVPVNFDCTKCPAKPCGDSEVCDVDTGLCTAPRGAVHRPVSTSHTSLSPQGFAGHLVQSKLTGTH